MVGELPKRVFPLGAGALVRDGEEKLGRLPVPTCLPHPANLWHLTSFSLCFATRRHCLRHRVGKCHLGADGHIAGSRVSGALGQPLSGRSGTSLCSSFTCCS